MISSRALRRSVFLAACACTWGSGLWAQDLRGVVEGVVVSEESGGPKGKEPTRYGDWESKGICWDF